MEVKFRTAQEDFWVGEFGNEYTERNAREKLLSSNISLFSSILTKTHKVESVIEYGANIGLNLRALIALNKDIKCSALEINNKAAQELRKISNMEVFECSVLDFIPSKKWDFVFTKGVLIHINPNVLPQVYNLV